jgi:hypothetical protein
VLLCLLVVEYTKYNVTYRGCAVKTYTTNESYKKYRSKYVARVQFCNWLHEAVYNYEVRPLITYFTDEIT